MHYYQFHIGDFRSGTVNMSRKARWIYRDMIDVYYDTEKPLPSDLDVLCDMLGIEDAEERMIVERHLRFKFEINEGAYRHPVCDSVIAEYHAKAGTARTNGKKGGRPPKKNQVETQNNPAGSENNPVGSENNPVGFENNPVETGLKTNHKPLTINHKPEDKSSCHRRADDGHTFRFAEIQDAYNRICTPTLPACLAANDLRRSQVKRMVNLEFNGKRPFREHGLAMWESYFADCLKNKHWCGDNERGWKAGFDHVTNPTHAIKLLESICG